jgi:quercetin dioxygenase-like cupin family protein
MVKKVILAVVSVAVVVAGSHYAAKAWATPASGFSAVTLAKGTLASFEVFNHSVSSTATNGDDDDQARVVWLSMQKTKGASDLYVQSNTWQVGGTTGWHSHPGHSLIIVTAGSVSNYEGDDPSCTPHVYTQGMSFVDSGGDHVHMIRNEGSVVAQTIAVQLIPAGATRRIDAADPGNCHF